MSYAVADLCKDTMIQLDRSILERLKKKSNISLMLLNKNKKKILTMHGMDQVSGAGLVISA